MGAPDAIPVWVVWEATNQYFSLSHQCFSLAKICLSPLLLPSSLSKSNLKKCPQVRVKKKKSQVWYLCTMQFILNVTNQDTKAFTLVIAEYFYQYRNSIDA